MSWEQLLSVAKERRERRATDAASQPTACPNDGTPLLRDRHGRWRCQFDGWTWNGVSHPLVDPSLDLTPMEVLPW